MDSKSDANKNWQNKANDIWQKKAIEAADELDIDESTPLPTMKAMADALEAEAHWIGDAVEDVSKGLETIVEAGEGNEVLFAKALGRKLTGKLGWETLNIVGALLFSNINPFKTGPSAATYERLLPFFILICEVGREMIPDDINDLEKTLIKAWLRHKTQLISEIDPATGNGTLPQSNARSVGVVDAVRDDGEPLFGMIDPPNSVCTDGRLGWEWANTRPRLPVSGASRLLTKTVARSTPIPPAAIRLVDFVSALIPVTQRRGGINTIDDLITLEMIASLIWPGGNHSWRWNRSRNISALADALRILRNIELPLPGGPSQGFYLPVVAHAIPGPEWGNDQPIPFSVYIPLAHAHGPRFNWRSLIEFGAKSSPQYWLYKGLCGYFDTYGSYRLKGKAMFRHWTEPRFHRNKDGNFLNAKDEVVPGDRYMIGSGRNARLRPDLIPLNEKGEKVQTIAEAARVPIPHNIVAYKSLTLSADIVPVAYPVGCTRNALRRSWNQLKAVVDTIGAKIVNMDGKEIENFPGKNPFRVLPPVGWGRGYKPPDQSSTSN